MEKFLCLHTYYRLCLIDEAAHSSYAISYASALCNVARGIVFVNAFMCPVHVLGPLLLVNFRHFSLRTDPLLLQVSF